MDTEKKTEFKKTLFGYSATEVDAKIKELEERNLELEKKLSDTEGTFTELLKMNLNLEDTKKQANAIIQQAYENADKILYTTKSNCDSILKGFKVQIEEQKSILDSMKKKVASFKNELFDKYKVQIEMLEKMQSAANESEDLSADQYVERVVSALKDNLFTEYESYGIDTSTVKKPEGMIENESVTPPTQTVEMKEIDVQPEAGNEKYVHIDEDKMSITQENKAISVMDMLSEYKKMDSQQFEADAGIQLALDIDAGIPVVRGDKK